MTPQKLLGIFCLALASTDLLAASDPAPTERAALPTGGLIQVGKTRAIRTIGEAAAKAKSGDTVEIDAGDYFADTAVWGQEKLTIRSVNGRARFIAGGASAEGKAIFVIRGVDVTVENIDFVGAKVADGNGAGIRFERGHLMVRNCVFSDNENGILTAVGPMSLEVENSEFANNGTTNGRGHSIYVGNIEKLRITGSYIHHAAGGHLLKSRAAENHVLANRLTDEIGGHASYELEFPNGGLNYVIGNIIEQGSDTQNATIVSVGAEGYNWPRNELYLVNNTIADDRPSNGIFLNVRNGIQKVKAVNNLLIGSGYANTGTTMPLSEGSKPGWGGFMNVAKNLAMYANDIRKGTEPPPAPTANGEFSNNQNADWDQFALAARYDYRLKPTSRLIGKVSEAGAANGVDLTQRLQYAHPHGTTPLTAKPRMPGALQSLGN